MYKHPKKQEVGFIYNFLNTDSDSDLLLAIIWLVLSSIGRPLLPPPPIPLPFQWSETNTSPPNDC